jgi:hypothetical protein
MPSNKQLQASKTRRDLRKNRVFLQIFWEDVSRYRRNDPYLVPITVIMRSGVIHEKVFVCDLNEKTGKVTFCRDSEQMYPTLIHTFLEYVYNVECVQYR